MDYAKIDFTTFLGETDQNGHWVDVEESKKNENEDEQSQEKIIHDDSMYVFEGVDYRSVAAKKADIDFFDRLLINDEHTNETSASSSKHHVSERPQRRQMTEEEKAERTAKIREAKARRQQEIASDECLF
jgi:hypothetical protein